MNHCKFCGADLPEDAALCPACGRDNAAETPAEDTAPVRAAEEPAAEEATVETSSEKPTEATSEEPTESTSEEAPVERSTEEAATEETAETSSEAPTVETTSETPAEAPAPAAPSKATPGKIALAVVAVVVLAAALIALIVAGLDRGEPQLQDAQGTESTEAAVETTVPATIPADGEPGTVTCKGTYTVSDEAAQTSRDQVVATMEGQLLTNAELRVYYWMEVQAFLSSYGSYAPYFGLDYTQPLDTQVCPQAEGLTWQQYFLQSALANWNQVQAMILEAEQAGLEMTPEEREYLDALPDSLEQMASSNAMTLEELMLRNIGPGADAQDYLGYEENYYRAAPYYNAQVDALVPTEEDLEAFFAAHEEDYASGGLSREDLFVDVRHILFTPEGGATDENGATTYSDEEWAACEAAAQEVLDQWLAGAGTEDTFAELAQLHSQDPGSSANGGLYENVYEGQMVQSFNDWCFDASRKAGDYGLVRTDYGYHIMYFLDSHPQWMYYAESDWRQEQTQQFLDALLTDHPMEVDYEKIELGLVEF